MADIGRIADHYGRMSANRSDTVEEIEPERHLW